MQVGVSLELINRILIIIHSSGILVPGGFGDRGIEGMIAACQYAREESESVRIGIESSIVMSRVHIILEIPFLGMFCSSNQCLSNQQNVYHQNSIEKPHK
jgi:hypothetical protein